MILLNALSWETQIVYIFHTVFDSPENVESFRGLRGLHEQCYILSLFRTLGTET